MTDKVWQLTIHACLWTEDKGRRPSGYTAHVAAFARRRGDVLLVPDLAYQSLKAHYDAGNPPPPEFNGQRYQWNVPHSRPAPVKDDASGTHVIPVQAQPVQAVPLASAADWPWPARLAYKLRKPEDVGVGDTAQRYLAVMGFKTMAALYTSLMHSLAEILPSFKGKSDCGCSNRQKLLNQYFPYWRDGKEVVH